MTGYLYRRLKWRLKVDFGIEMRGWITVRSVNGERIKEIEISPNGVLRYRENTEELLKAKKLKITKDGWIKIVKR